MDERLRECVSLRVQLRDLGVDALPELEPIRRALLAFVRDGHSTTVRITVSSIHRRIILVLANRVPSTCTLQKM